MNVKRGRFAVYKGKEYQADKDNTYSGKEKMMFLISFNPDDVMYGFKEVAPNRFTKTVPFSEIETAYSIYTKGKYKGLPISILEKIGDLYKIHHGENGLAAEKLGFIKIEPGWFEKVVPVHDLENIHEKKTPLWGFSL